MTETNSQRTYGLVFLVAAAAFFYFGGEMLAKHSSWSDFKDPPGVAEIFGLLASVIGAVAAAFKIDLGLVRGLFGKGGTE